MSKTIVEYVNAWLQEYGRMAKLSEADRVGLCEMLQDFGAQMRKAGIEEAFSKAMKAIEKSVEFANAVREHTGYNSSLLTGGWIASQQGKVFRALLTDSEATERSEDPGAGEGA